MIDHPLRSSSETPSIDQRLTRVEARLDELSRLVADRLAGATPPPAAPPPDESDDDSLAQLIPKNSTVMNGLQQLGRACLILAGAFLIRAVTDAQAVPRPAGAALGLLYALGWIAAAGRSARRGRPFAGAFLGATGILIGDLLVFELATRFRIVGPAGAAVLLAGLAAAALTVARLAALPSLAWTCVLATAVTAASLSVATGEIVPFAAALLAVGIGASAWMASGGVAWSRLRWPAAAGADILVALAAARLASFGEGRPPARAAMELAALGGALALSYLVTFSARAVALRSEVAGFEILQSAAAVGVGVGAVVVASSAGGWGFGPVGLAAVLLGGSCYAAALGILQRRDGRTNGAYFATLACALTLFGSALLLETRVASLLWSGLALAALAASRDLRRAVFASHAAVFAAAAAWGSGLAGSAFEALVSPAAAARPAFPAAGLAAGVAAAAALVWLLRPRLDRREDHDRLPRAVFAALLCLAVCGIAAARIPSLFPGQNGRVDPGVLAVIRTGVIAAAALAVGVVGRRGDHAELRWLSVVLVAAGGGKLLLEDVRVGRAATLFPAFILYGIALLSLPRMLRRADRSGAGAGP